jgi:hypothetical protein
MTKIRKIVITFMLAFYLAVNTCDKSYYFSYNTSYHSIVLEDVPDIISSVRNTYFGSDFQPGRFVKQAANFYPGLNMVRINEYRFSLN